MTETFSPTQTLKSNVTAVAMALNYTMRSNLENPTDEHEAIHLVRKEIKKMRALIRLIRVAIGETHFKVENTDYRDIGRNLSGLRDATALIETVDKLLKTAPNNLYEELFSIKAALTAERKELFKDLGDQTKVRKTILQDLSVLKGRISEWPLKEEDFSTWATGLKKTYKKGKKLCKMAALSQDAHDFHEWRKQVKYLWNQLRFLKELWPPISAVYIEMLSDLSSLLGDEHDLTIFKEKISSDGIAGEISKDLASLIEEDVKLLRAQALELGQLIYAEKSSAFFSRKAVYWAVGQGKHEIKNV